MDLNKGYAAVFKNRGVDVAAAYDVAVAEVAAALHLGGDEVAAWLDTYSGRLFAVWRSFCTGIGFCNFVAFFCVAPAVSDKIRPPVQVTALKLTQVCSAWLARLVLVTPPRRRLKSYSANLPTAIYVNVLAACQ